MKKHFYSTIVNFGQVVSEISTLDATDVEKKELEELAHEHLHQTILDAILAELSLREKKIFLANLKYETDEKIWKHLNAKVDKVEDKIKAAADTLGRELTEDIKAVRKSKNSL